MLFGTFLVTTHIGLSVLALSAGKKYEVPKKWCQIVFWTLFSLPLLTTIGSSIYHCWYLLFAWLVSLVFLPPYPIKPIYRRDYELRGYTMTLFQEYLLIGISLMKWTTTNGIYV